MRQLTRPCEETWEAINNVLLLLLRAKPQKIMWLTISGTSRRLLLFWRTNRRPFRSHPHFVPEPSCPQKMHRCRVRERIKRDSEEARGYLHLKDIVDGLGE